MAGLEAVLRIVTKEDGSGLAQLKAQIAGIDKQIATFDKLMSAVGKVAKATDPMIASIAASSRALKEQKAAVTSLAEGLDSVEGSSAAAAGGQERLAASIAATNRVMAVQGVEAARVAEKIVQAQRLAGGGGAREGRGGFWSEMRGLAPFAAPEGAHVWREALGEGATLDNAMARLRTSNLATPEDIAKASADYREFSKTHTGVTEAEYLTSFREALSNAPKDEAFHLAGKMATIKLALRNSGVSSTAEDNLATIRAMDELGFKTEAERDRYLDETTKMRQVFGDQIKMSTYLSAIQNAHAAAYDWSDEFKYRYLPTLLQMSGEQGGTQIATGYSNYVGQHMQQSELRALADAGFVSSSDLIRNKVGDVRGVRKGAQLFETDMFMKNIVQWAFDFHQAYMSRKGATEAGFSKLVARMPRNMGGMIEGIVHGAPRFGRDAGLIGNAPGQFAASDTFGGQNPGAALEALRELIAQFGAVVAGPAVQAAAPAMMKLAQAITTISSAAGQFEKDHPGAGTAVSSAATFGGGAAVLWGLWKMFTGVSKFLGFGGGGAGGAAGGGAAAPAAGGALGRIIGGVVGAASLPGLIDLVTGDNRTPEAKAIDAAILGKIRSWFYGPGAPMQLPGAMPASPIGAPLGLYRAATLAGRDVHSPATGPYAYYPPQQAVSVTGQAQVDHTVRLDIHVDLSPELRAKIDQIANDSHEYIVPLLGGGTGQMDTDAAPHRRGGIGHF